MKKRTIAQTPSPAKDIIVGSYINKKNSATKQASSTIELSERTINELEEKLQSFKEKHHNTTNINLNDLKAVYRRGSGAYSFSHRPNITRAGWSYARVNKFLEKAAGNKVKEAYIQDDDLLKYKQGGKVLNQADKMGKQIVCKNCGWKWNTDNSDEHNKYICNKCNFDNRTFYNSDPVGYADGGLIAPNGKPSKLTLEKYKIVRTPAFKKWFGDWENDPENASKVVDENGEPLILYHGSRQVDEKSKFNIFKFGDGAWGKGIYFTSNEKEAKGFALGNYIYEVFLSIKNPFIEKYYRKWEQWKMIPKNDGIIVMDLKDVSMVVAFEPNQIKLADGTNTTFDLNNPDIRYKKGGQVKTYWYKGLFKTNYFANSDILEKGGNVDSEYADYVKRVYDLAIFNSKLKKGYRVQLTEKDYADYEEKNKEIQRLVDIAIKNKYEVHLTYDVVYFIIDGIQISFHYPSGFPQRIKIHGLPIEYDYEWHGVKNAFKYSKDEYEKLKKEREKIRNIRILYVDDLKKDLVIEANKLLKYYNNILKRTKNIESIKYYKNIIKNIEEVIEEKSIPYKLLDVSYNYTSQVYNTKKIFLADFMKEYKKTMQENYIYEFSVG